MSIKKIIDWRIESSRKEIKGVVDGLLKRQYDDSGNPDAWVYICDVKIQGDKVLKNVPITSNNRDIFYSQLSKPVSLNNETGKWSITGLSKVDFGFTHITYVTFTEDIAEIIWEDWSGYETRPLTYGELGSVLWDGYGYLPYGTMGRFTKAGIFIELIGG